MSFGGGIAPGNGNSTYRKPALYGDIYASSRRQAISLDVSSQKLPKLRIVKFDKHRPGNADIKRFICAHLSNRGTHLWRIENYHASGVLAVLLAAGASAADNVAYTAAALVRTLRPNRAGSRMGDRNCGLECDGANCFRT